MSDEIDWTEIGPENFDQSDMALALMWRTDALNAEVQDSVVPALENGNEPDPETMDTVSNHLTQVVSLLEFLGAEVDR